MDRKRAPRLRPARSVGGTKRPLELLRVDSVRRRLRLRGCLFRKVMAVGEGGQLGYEAADLAEM